MKTVILYGEMGKKFGREHKFAVSSAAEAIQALSANFNGFRNYMMNAHKFGVGFKVFVGNKSLKREADSALPSSDSEVIRIAPAIFGSGGFVRFLLGAALIAFGAGAFGLTGVLGIGTQVSNAIFGLGAALVLGSISEALSDPPKAPSFDGVDQSTSYIFSGPENTTRQGGAIPVGYGTMMIGSTVISAGIEDSDQ